MKLNLILTQFDGNQNEQNESRNKKIDYRKYNYDNTMTMMMYTIYTIL